MVRPLGGHGVPGVGQADDGGGERDLRSGEPVRVAAAVPALVVVPDDRHRVAEPAEPGHDAGALGGVLLDAVVLLLRAGRPYTCAVDLDLVFLGTSGSVPTARRGLAGTLVRRGGERMLVDCGEGTQRQLLRSTVGLVELPEVFLTHYHADHYLGLPGMLKTFALRGREMPLTVYGPPGLKDLFGGLRRIFGKLTYPVELVELRDGDALDRGDYRILAVKVAHGVPANGYAFVELPRPGRFDVATARALGVPEGPLFGRLQAGEADRAAGRREGGPRAGPRPAPPRAQGRPRRRHRPGGERARGR